VRGHQGREQLTQDAAPMIAKAGKTDNSTFASSNPHKRRKSISCNHLGNAKCYYLSFVPKNLKKIAKTMSGFYPLLAFPI
jgi:hypothetical protein